MGVSKFLESVKWVLASFEVLNRQNDKRVFEDHIIIMRI